MDLGNYSSSDILKRLTCDNCENYLSYFPIFLSPRMENFCGRCYMTPCRGERLRNEVYETICQFLKFPCRYKCNGCSEKLFPKDMPEHEESCQNKPVECPSKCSWKGPSPKLLQHYQKEHTNLMLVNDKEFKMDLINFPQQENFLEYKGILFTSSRKFNLRNNMLEWAIYRTENITSVENFSCEIIVINNKRKISVEINTSNTSGNFDYTAISLTCLEIESDALSAVLGKISFENDDQAKLTNLKTIFFELMMAVENKEVKQMLSAIKCFMCSNYVTPPIFECLKEEAALCLNCQNKHVRKCEMCEERAAINNSNICLDKIAKCLNYPCRYKAYGCAFVAKHDEITKHHELCPHKMYSCPVREFVKCKWRGLLQDVSSHIDHSHNDMTYDVENFKVYLSDTKNESKSGSLIDNPVECDLVEFKDRFFRLTYTREESAFYFEMQMVDNFDKLVTFEIEILDHHQEGKRLLMRKLCSPLSRRALLFSNTDKCCFFTLDQVAPFLSSDGMITFSVNIFDNK